MEAAGVMQWTVRLEARTSAGEVKTTELATFSRPAVIGTLAEIGAWFKAGLHMELGEAGLTLPGWTMAP